MMQLTRTFGAQTCAKPTVIALSAALAPAYGMNVAGRPERAGAAHVDDGSAVPLVHAGADAAP